MVTNGEVIVEINNNQLGMGNLHSTLSTCGAVVGAVLACAACDECEGVCVCVCSAICAVFMTTLRVECTLHVYV